LRPLVEAELNTFEALYQRADIEPFYYPEAQAIDALMMDSVRLAVVTRGFTQEERDYFKEIKITPTQLDVALSAVALIVHRDNPDTLINMDQIRSLLRGKINLWSQLGSKNKAGIEIVFDNPNSGLIRHLKDSVAQVETLPPNTFAVKNNEAVIDHVSQNENALGLIGLEWISDKDDSTSNSFLERVRVMSVAGDSAHFKPYQAYLALKYYPLARRITILSREARSGLGSGFMAFFASERGQRIVLKAGLVPVTMPLRVVEIDRRNFEIEN
ncbi:MAG TPA: substrate-binding domain-containing protein, partial [Chryseosolibacter sp.]|nr:substrate-binding domain-containing protein [Chryseosolibacter sp.]